MQTPIFNQTVAGLLSASGGQYVCFRGHYVSTTGYQITYPTSDSTTDHDIAMKAGRLQQEVARPSFWAAVCDVACGKRHVSCSCITGMLHEGPHPCDLPKVLLEAKADLHTTLGCVQCRSDETEIAENQMPQHASTYNHSANFLGVLVIVHERTNCTRTGAFRHRSSNAKSLPDHFFLAKIGC